MLGDGLVEWLDGPPTLIQLSPINGWTITPLKPKVSSKSYNAILIRPPFVKWHFRFTIVPFKLVSDQGCGIIFYPEN